MFTRLKQLVVAWAIFGSLVGAQQKAEAATPAEPEAASGQKKKEPPAYLKTWKVDMPVLDRLVDLNVGETRQVELSNGRAVSVKLIDLKDRRDTVRQAVRQAEVTVEIDGQRATVVWSHYSLPITVGEVQIDCPITKASFDNGNPAVFGLKNDVRLRLWPKDSPWLAPGTFCYPLKQKWFASATQMGNEPTYVDGVERPERKQIYYHYDLDFGGAENLTEIVAVSEGIITWASAERAVVVLRDHRGWDWAYAHLASIDPAVKEGLVVRMGQKIGMLGKAGSSGGWSHVHFQLTREAPDGQRVHVEPYPFIWEAALREQEPPVIAVARPHNLVWVEEEALLDGSRSWSADGKGLKYEWTLSDGTKAEGRVQKRKYDKAGQYSEILKVTDVAGNVAYDFAIVQVIGRGKGDGQVPPGIHAAYFPTMGIKTGQALTFKARTFGTTLGEELWDFGDGTHSVTTKSDGNVNPHAADGYAVTTHAFERAGDYIVTVKRTNEYGLTGMARLWVRVEK